MTRATLLLIPILTALLPSCADTTEHTQGRTRLVQLPQRAHLITLRPGEAAPEVLLRTHDTVLFIENGSQDQHLSVVIGGTGLDPTTSPSVMGFAYDEPGQRIYTPTTIPPGGYATVCLLDAGEFSYEVWFEGQRAGEGKILVTVGGVQ